MTKTTSNIRFKAKLLRPVRTSEVGLVDFSYSAQGRQREAAHAGARASFTGCGLAEHDDVLHRKPLRSAFPGEREHAHFAADLRLAHFM